MSAAILLGSIKMIGTGQADTTPCPEWGQKKCPQKEQPPCPELKRSCALDRGGSSGVAGITDTLMSGSITIRRM